MRITQTALSAVAVALVYMATPAIAQTAGAAPVAAAEVDQNAAIMAFFEEYDAQQLARSPLSKSYRGIKDSDYGKWDDGSDAAEAREHGGTTRAAALVGEQHALHLAVDLPRLPLLGRVRQRVTAPDGRSPTNAIAPSREHKNTAIVIFLS